MIAWCIVSCRKNRQKTQKCINTWVHMWCHHPQFADLRAQFPSIFIVVEGNPNAHVLFKQLPEVFIVHQNLQQRITWDEKVMEPAHFLYLGGVPDNYEHLPWKTFTMFQAVTQKFPRVKMIWKIDDSMCLLPGFWYQVLPGLVAGGGDYIGNINTRKDDYFSTYHSGKCQNASVNNAKYYVLRNFYCHGPLYGVQGELLEKLRKLHEFPPAIETIYEDVEFGKWAAIHGGRPTAREIFSQHIDKVWKWNLCGYDDVWGRENWQGILQQHLYYTVNRELNISRPFRKKSVFTCMVDVPVFEKIRDEQMSRSYLVEGTAKLDFLQSSPSEQSAHSRAPRDTLHLEQSLDAEHCKVPEIGSETQESRRETVETKPSQNVPDEEDETQSELPDDEPPEIVVYFPDFPKR